MIDTGSDTCYVAGPIEGWLFKDEMKALSDWAFDCKVIVEVGCWKGLSTDIFLASSEATVFTVDSFVGGDEQRQLLQANLDKYIKQGRLFILDMSSAKGAEVLAGILKYNKADMVFLDGDHQYQSVVADIKSYLPLVKPGGMICGHDSCPSDNKYNPFVRPAVNDTLPGWHQGVNTLWYKKIE